MKPVLWPLSYIGTATMALIETSLLCLIVSIISIIGHGRPLVKPPYLQTSKNSGELGEGPGTMMALVVQADGFGQFAGSQTVSHHA